LNPLYNDAVLANGNLEWNGDGSISHKCTTGTIGISSGKYYWEAEYTVASYSYIAIGMQKVGTPVIAVVPGYLQDYAFSILSSNGDLYYNNNGSSYGVSWAVGDIIGVRYDNGSVYFYKNGTIMNSGTAAVTGLTGTWVPIVHNIENGAWAVNFGQYPFRYTPPTDHLSLCTTNLPDPTIADGSIYFDTKLWTGDGNSTRTISSYGFSPDFVWIKNRTLTGWQHVLYDQIRGAGTSSVVKSLSTNSTRSEASGNDANHGYLSGFTSDGFDLVKGSQAGGDYVNHNTNAYVGWAWDAGTSTVSNSDGSITSNVRANASAGFSIIGFTGNATVGATIGHGLNSKPEFFTIKVRSSEANWYTYHKAYGATKYLTLDRTHAAVANTYLNNTEPTSSVITLNNTFEVNGVNENIICLAWTSVAGYSSFGSYQGNGSVDGTFVFTGFRPRFILLKRYDASGHSWNIMDTARSTNNVVAATLFPDSSAAEASSVSMDILSNGFKFRTSSGGPNGSGMDYIYAAYAEHPFASNARAR
jgi:hypothetical protein